MDAVLTLILFLLFLDILLTIIAVCILVYNRIIVFRKTLQQDNLITEIKEYFKKEGIHKIGF